MSKIVNITDKLSSSKPTIQLGDKTYEINDSMETVFKFEEMASSGNKGMVEAVKMALGEKAYRELGVAKMSVGNFKVIVVALLAAMQGVSYEEAEARFQK